MVKNTSESGRSMVEMLGVIAIIGVIAVGGITSMSYIDSYFRTSSTLMEVDQIASDVMDLCSWSTVSGYEGCLSDDATERNDLLCSENVLSCSAGEARNRWGGRITVAPKDQDNFEITYTEVPESVCEQMEEEMDATAQNHVVRLKSCTGGSAVFDLPPYVAD